MKKLFLLLTSLHVFSFATFSLAPPTQAVEIKMEYDQKGNLMVFAKNKDFCEYYLSIILSEITGSDISTFPYSATINKGDRKLFTIKRVSDYTYPNGRVTYMAYRGKMNPKINPDFIYSFPVKPGDSIRVSPVGNADFTLSFDLSFAGDTVYACREGYVCDDKLTDQTSKGSVVSARIIVNHKDGTFSEYSQFEKSLVYPGEYVKLGQPIAINTGKTLPKKIINFAVYYLDKNKVQNRETGSKYSHIVPVFHTLNAGDIKLEANTTYIGEMSDHLITQEMSEKEKKKYEKNKGK